jgi:hypothetical protein
MATRIGTKRTKQCQFRPDHELDHIQFTLPLEEYTDSERWNCFYSPEEWQEMKDGVLNLLAVLETGEIDARDACIRGLDRLYGERQKKLRVYVLLLVSSFAFFVCL